MDYGLSDSSGTDDDFPPSHQNRFQRGGRAAVNPRSTMGGAVPLPSVHGDMETQIHLIEQEAYCAVLRAFKAQSDAITWDKESVITELRKELRVSDEEHRELLSRVNADDMIRRIREWRKATGLQPGMLSTPQPVHDLEPSPTISASHKKPKTSHSVASLSMVAPSPALHPPVQSSSGALRRGPPPGARIKKPKSSMQYPSASLSTRPQAANRAASGTFGVNEPAEPATYDPLIGKKVWTRWPEDNSFYEAVITEYNPAEGGYRFDYTDGTWEYVNLKEIPPEDIRWEGEDPGVSRKGGRPAPSRGVRKSMTRGGGVSSFGRGRGNPKFQNKKDVSLNHNGIGKKALGDIKLLHTDTLVKEVEELFGAAHPDPVEIEEVDKVLKEHEEALVEAIARLEHASDGESGGREHRFPHGQSMQ